jgi:hypothetical protein
MRQGSPAAPRVMCRAGANPRRPRPRSPPTSHTREHAPARSRAPGVRSAPFASCSFTRCGAFGVTLSAIDCRQCEFGASFMCRLGRTVDVALLPTLGRAESGVARSTSPRRRSTTSGEMCPTEPKWMWWASASPADKAGFKAGDDIVTPDRTMLGTSGKLAMDRVTAPTRERRRATPDVCSGALAKAGKIR